MMTAQPIFIHSLWRSGSTYIFNVFRRSQGGYWCYQEPLHEIPLLAKDNPSSLLQHHGEKIKLLRHPPIDTPYFQELYEVASESLAHLTKHAIYDAYFETESEDGQNGISYFRALIEAAKGIPVIQECRTSARISLIKNKLGGVHIYLWRNPWDQWWSYKVADYFDVVNQLIINSQTHPHEIAYLRKEIDFREFHDDNIMHEFEWFSKLRLSPEHSYLVFYTLWCLALKSGIQNADVILNIDRLSDSLEYRSQFKQHLTELSVTGLDFSDCHVPQAIYNETDTAFFLPIEDKVYGILLLNGWSITEVDKIKTLRLEYEPLCRKTAASPTTETLSVQIEQAARARALAKRFEGQLSEAYKCIRRAETQRLEAEARAQEVKAAFEARLAEVEAALAEAEARARRAETQRLEAEARAQEVKAAFEARLAEVEAALASICNSRSWRITRPLRQAAHALRRAKGGLLAILLRAKRSIKDILRPPLTYLIRLAIRHPEIKSKAVAVIRRFPALDARLRRFAAGQGLTAGLASGVGVISAGSEEFVSTDIIHLTPRARKIYADLKAAIERQKGAK